MLANNLSEYFGSWTRKQTILCDGSEVRIEILNENNKDISLDLESMRRPNRLGRH